jgi:hypothetical protein
MKHKQVIVSLLCAGAIFLQAGCFMDKNNTVISHARKHLKSHTDMTKKEIRIFIHKGNIGEERLVELSKSKSWNVRVFAALNEHLPVEYLEKMLGDKSWKVVRACSWNPNFTEPMFEKLTHHKDKRVRGYLANQGNAPLYLANHSRLPLDNLITLSKDESCWVRGQAAKNPRLPETEMRRLFLEGNVNGGLAENHKVPMDILMIFSEDDDLDIRKKVASNPSLPEKDMRRLFSENKSEKLDSSTRRGLAGNPNTPIDILIELSKDENIGTRSITHHHPKMRQRGRAAQNPKLPEAEMRRLFREGGRLVRAGLAANPKVPMDILTTLSEDNDPIVRKQVASNPNLPEKDVRRLFSEKGHARMRTATKSGLVKNPNTPLDILIELSKDKERYMRNFALQHPKMKQYLKIQAN